MVILATPKYTKFIRNKAEKIRRRVLTQRYLPRVTYGRLLDYAAQVALDNRGPSFQHCPTSESARGMPGPGQ
jgi:hypothetical protein